MTLETPIVTTINSGEDTVATLYETEDIVAEDGIKQTSYGTYEVEETRDVSISEDGTWKIEETTEVEIIAPTGVFATMSIDIIEPEPTDDRLRWHSSKEQQRLAGVIIEHGVQRPVLFNRTTRRLIKGRGVLEALKAAGYTHALVQLVNLDETTERVVRIALGAAYSKTQKEVLAEELHSLDALGVDLDYTGLPTPEIERLMNGPKEPVEKKPIYCQNCGEIVEAK